MCLAQATHASFIFWGLCCGLGEGERLPCPPPWENECVLTHNSSRDRVLEKNKRKKKKGRGGREKDFNFETGCLGKLGCVCTWSTGGQA